MNIIAALQRWMDSKPGQTFLNYAYSWGASVVILGTLFKLTHLKGANLMLFIGMGTEVVVFFLSAFDRPFQTKNEEAQAAADESTSAGVPYADGIENGLAIVADAALSQDDNKTNGASREELGAHNAAPTDSREAVGHGSGAHVGTTGVNAGATIIAGEMGGGTIVVGDASAMAGESNAGGNSNSTAHNAAAMDASQDKAQIDNAFTPSAGLQAAASQQGIGGNSLLDIIRLANKELLQRAQASITPEMEEASKKYVAKLQQLTETLERVEQQSARLTTDSEEMANLNRTLTGINTVYELQLKSISQQVGTIDSINEQTRRMAAQIEELNGVYARMIKALTVNMKNAANTMG